jgi:hypothetical protein
MALEGDLEDVALTLLIQMACSDKKTARLTIRAPEGKGDVFFEAGEIVHAEVGLLEGEKAVYRLLASTSGRFRLSTESPPPVQADDPDRLEQAADGRDAPSRRAANG